MIPPSSNKSHVLHLVVKSIHYELNGIDLFNNKNFVDFLKWFLNCWPIHYHHQLSPHLSILCRSLASRIIHPPLFFDVITSPNSGSSSAILHSSLPPLSYTLSWADYMKRLHETGMKLKLCSRKFFTQHSEFLFPATTSFLLFSTSIVNLERFRVFRRKISYRFQFEPV